MRRELVTIIQSVQSYLVLLTRSIFILKKVSLGTPLCPCRFYEDKEAEAKDGYWNCPCVPMRERHECHCMLFLTDDNAFAGDDQVCEMLVEM